MAYSAAVFTALASFFFVLSPSAGAPPETEPPLYFPVKAGTRWVYWDGTREITRVVDKVESRADEKVVSVVELKGGGRKVPSEKIVVTGTGLARVELGGHEFESPLRLLKCPCKAGDEWELRTTTAAVSADRGTATVLDTEEVKVPAGTYKAVRMVYRFQHNGQHRETTIWFAPKVGLVKLEDVDGSRQILKSFTPGRE